MYQSLKFLPLKAGSLEAIGDAVVDASGGATDVVTNMFKKIAGYGFIAGNLMDVILGKA